MRLTGLALFVTLLAGCPTPQPPPPTDVPRRDAGMDAFDAAGLDVPGLDTPELDAPGLDVPGLDAPELDVPGLDAPVMRVDVGEPDVLIMIPDGGSCALPDGGFDVCACTTRADACGAGSTCPRTEQQCVDDGCGSVCVPRGGLCLEDSDCPATSTCKFDGYGRSCSRMTTGCTDSRECPRGFACVAGTCSDRRIGCGGPEGIGECPVNFYCDSSLGPPHCVRMLRGCGTDGGCPGDGECHDVDGDGDRECVAGGPCTTNAMCSAGRTCQSEPVEVISTCGTHGPCRTAADCSAGQLCQDLWGDGIRECVDAGGSCDAVADCSGRGICGTPNGGGPPTCIERPLGG